MKCYNVAAMLLQISVLYGSRIIWIIVTIVTLAKVLQNSHTSSRQIEHRVLQGTSLRMLKE